MGGRCWATLITSSISWRVAEIHTGEEWKSHGLSVTHSSKPIISTLTFTLELFWKGQVSKISLPIYLIQFNPFSLCPLCGFWLCLDDDLQLKLNVEIIQLTKYNNVGTGREASRLPHHICVASVWQLYRNLPLEIGFFVRMIHLEIPIQQVSLGIFILTEKKRTMITPTSTQEHWPK